MPAPKLTEAQCHQAAEAYRRMGGDGYRLIGLGQSAFESRVTSAIERGLLHRTERRTIPQDEPMPEIPELDIITPALRVYKGGEQVSSVIAAEAVRKALSKRRTLDDLAQQFQTTRGAALDAVEELREAGYAVHESDGAYWLDTTPRSGIDTLQAHEYTSRDDGSYVFGFTSDNHIGSKYSRLDVLGRLFDRFAEVGVDRVFNAGNWVDGEASFNKHDLLVHGMHQQCHELARAWPQRGLTTYAVAGDDHEGWWAQREGVDIGRYAEQCFREAGREDWVNLGYMEADIRMIHANSGATNRLRVAHPGGGSSYATSYAPQKYLESLQGGDKPGVVLLGHWHKLEFINIRGVWVIQTGCTQDQTPFGRKKRLDFQVGGGLCRIQQDPKSGALVSCTVELMQFFNREFYGTGRWSHSEPVTMPERAA